MKKPILFLLIGFVVGMLATWHLTKFMPRRMDPETRHKQTVKLFNKRLNLSKDQQSQVSAILDETRKKIDALRAESKPKFEEVRHETREKIKKLLTPEQQKKYDVLDAELEVRRQKRR